jgi:hypothetical protein
MPHRACVTPSSSFVFPPAPSAEAGAAAKEEATQASVKLRTNGQLQVLAGFCALTVIRF